MNTIKTLNVIIGGDGPTFDGPSLYDVLGVAPWAFWTIVILSVTVIILAIKLAKKNKK